MAKYLAQASIDEHGNISGGSAGNQNGKELNTRELYSSSSRPWLYVVRAKNETVRKQICEQAKAAVANPYIGYDQYQRNTVLTQAKAVGWKLANIKTACETDCSALAGLVMICGVYLVLGNSAGSAAYNALYAGGNLPATSNFKSKVPTAYFDTLNFSSFSNCQHGDVLVRDGHAVIVVDAIVSSNGMSSGSGGGSLASSSYPCKGWTGDEVRKLQSALIAKGYSCGSSGVDGSFGSDTDAAVRKFQKENGLEVDGIAGPKTQAALYGSGGGSLASSSYPCKGWTGDEVRKLQSALIAKGYSCGSSGVDGSFGSDTDAAVRKFQKENGLEVDGIAGPKTQAALYGSGGGSLASSSYPCKGWTGDEVRKLQSALIAKGYSCGSSGVDGSFGSDTDAAVRKFQKENGLEVDGIAGPKTQAALYGSGGGSAGYETGTYVTTVGCLNVRTGAGTGYSRKTKKQLTADGQKHSNSAGQLNAGTAVTVMQIQYDSAGNPWGMIPSGWICLAWQGKQYVRKK